MNLNALARDLEASHVPARPSIVDPFVADDDLAQSLAAALADRETAHNILAGLRDAAGLTQEEVARRLGKKQPLVSRLERADLEATLIRTIATYIEAIGGTAELVLHLDGASVSVPLHRPPAAPMATGSAGRRAPPLPARG